MEATLHPSILLGLALLAFDCSSAGAAENFSGRNLAATCTTCHSMDAKTSGGMPTLAGREKAYIVTAMQEFRDGKRPATVMHQIAKGYSDAQADQIAAYFSQQKP